jgi:hypothetical protein
MRRRYVPDPVGVFMNDGRFTPDRLVGSPDEVRAEVSTILTAAA